MPTDCPRSLFHVVLPAPDCQSVCKSPDHALARKECFGLHTPLSRVQIGINACRRYRSEVEPYSVMRSVPGAIAKEPDRGQACDLRFSVIATVVLLNDLGVRFLQSQNRKT